MTTLLRFNLRRNAAVACTLLVAGLATQARAFTLTVADVIGYVVNAEPSNPPDETARLQLFVNLANTGSAVLPSGFIPILGPNVPLTLPTPVTLGVPIAATSFPVTVPTPYTYLMAKYGPDAVYYYLGGQTGPLTAAFIPPGLGANGNGLSHITLFNQIGGGNTVPDHGATSALLGTALLCLGISRRKFAS